jgi:nicotinamide-nucleotide amidase
MQTDTELYQLAQRLGARLNKRGQVLATAESCTGGWVAKLITDVPGSSAWFDRGFVTYSNQSKQDLLEVPADTLEVFGAVSGETVRAMAEGALTQSAAQVTLAVSGIAGPDGGTPAKPVGTVWFAWAFSDADTASAHLNFEGDREAVRRQAVAFALSRLLELLDDDA